MIHTKDLTEPEYAKLLAHIATQTPPNADDHKYKLLIYLMGEAGLRVGEAVRLCWEHVWFSETPSLCVLVPSEISKSKIGREVPMSSVLTHVLIRYRQLLPAHRVLPSAYLFTGRYDDNGHLSERAVQCKIQEISFRALGYSIHPHMLRHTFGSRMMRRTSLRVVQDLMGHKSISSTQVYTHPNATDRDQAINGLDTKTPK